MKKAALFTFNGDPMCFIHVLLNALDMDSSGWTIRIVIEGAATGLVPDLEAPEHPLHVLWTRAKTAGLVEGVCRACASKMNVLAAAQAAGLRPLDDMAGHPGMARFRKQGFDVITF